MRSILGTGLLAGALALMAAVPAMAQSQPAPSQPAPAAAQPRKPASPASPNPAPLKPAAKPAPAAEEPSRTSATYEDWVVRCERPEGGGPKVCEVGQTLQIGEPQQNLSVQVVFGKMRPDAPLRLVLQLPAGVWLQADPSLVMGDGAIPIQTVFRFCVRACVADVELTPQQAAGLSTAKGAGTLSFQDGSRKTAVLPISLKGLAPALAARETM